MKLLPVLHACGLLLALHPTVQASPQSLQEKYEQKLAKPFVRFGGWETDYDAARTRAREEGKPLFVYFSRSYAP